AAGTPRALDRARDRGRGEPRALVLRDVERREVGERTRVRGLPVVHEAIARERQPRTDVGRRGIRLERGRGALFVHGATASDHVSVSTVAPWSRNARSSSGSFLYGRTWKVSRQPPVCGFFATCCSTSSPADSPPAIVMTPRST